MYPIHDASKSVNYDQSEFIVVEATDLLGISIRPIFAKVGQKLPNLAISFANLVTFIPFWRKLWPKVALKLNLLRPKRKALDRK